MGMRRKRVARMGNRKTHASLAQNLIGDRILDENIIIQEVLGRTNPLFSFDVSRTAQKTTRPIILQL
jgi:hypothetical protein